MAGRSSNAFRRRVGLANWEAKGAIVGFCRDERRPANVPRTITSVNAAENVNGAEAAFNGLEIRHRS